MSDAEMEAMIEASLLEPKYTLGAPVHRVIS